MSPTTRDRFNPYYRLRNKFYLGYPNQWPFMHVLSWFWNIPSVMYHVRAFLKHLPKYISAILIICDDVTVSYVSDTRCVLTRNIMEGEILLTTNDHLAVKKRITNTYSIFPNTIMLRSHEGQNIWQCTGDEKDVFWWRWVPMLNVWSHEKNSHAMYCRTFGEPSEKYHRCIAEYSAMHRGIVGN